jgi:hypothetical protein
MMGRPFSKKYWNFLMYSEILRILALINDKFWRIRKLWS